MKKIMMLLTCAVGMASVAAPVRSMVAARNIANESEQEGVQPYWGLCFTAEEPNVVINMSKTGSPSAVTLETSRDGVKWTAFDADTGTTPITLENVGDYVYFRAGSGGNTRFASAQSTNYRSFTLSGYTSASGSIMSILNGKDKNNVTLTERYCFERLFYQCTKLLSSPELPATTLSNNCYDWMFRGCTALKSTPILPAKDLKGASYEYMFGDCTSLVNPPPSIGNNGWAGAFACMGMFYRCKNLIKSPIISALGTSNSELSHMFYQCSNLKEIKVTFENWGATSGNTQSCLNWVAGVSSTGTFYCPTALGTNDTIERGANRCPTGWTVVNTD